MVIKNKKSWQITKTINLFSGTNFCSLHESKIHCGETIHLPVNAAPNDFAVRTPGGVTQWVTCSSKIETTRPPNTSNCSCNFSLNSLDWLC